MNSIRFHHLSILSEGQTLYRDHSNKGSLSDQTPIAQHKYNRTKRLHIVRLSGKEYPVVQRL